MFLYNSWSFLSTMPLNSSSFSCLNVNIRSVHLRILVNWKIVWEFQITNILLLVSQKLILRECLLSVTSSWLQNGICFRIGREKGDVCFRVFSLNFWCGGLNFFRPLRGRSQMGGTLKIFPAEAKICPLS